MQVILPIETVEKVAERYKDSYFTAAVSFARKQDKDEVEIDSDALSFLALADKDFLSDKMDYLGIRADDFSRHLLENLIKINKDSPTIIGNYVPELIRLNMYEEFQTYVFSQLTHEEFRKFYKTHKDLLTVEFMTAYPFLNKDNSTFLILVCSKAMPDIAMELIKTGQANIGHVNNNGDTALMWACSNEMFGVALKLIETGQANVGYVNKNGYTALILACSTDMSELALKLIETGQANIENIDKDGDTALILARKNNMSDVVLKLQ